MLKIIVIKINYVYIIKVFDQEKNFKQISYKKLKSLIKS